MARSGIAGSSGELFQVLWKHTKLIFRVVVQVCTSTSNGGCKLFYFIGYFFFFLHFECYYLSRFPLQNPPLPSSISMLLWLCSPNYPPTPTSPPWHSPTLRHQVFTGPRASPPTDARKGHPLPHMRLSLHVYSGSWFSPWELWGRGRAGWLMLLLFLWGCKSFQLLQSFL